MVFPKRFRSYIVSEKDFDNEWYAVKQESAGRSGHGHFRKLHLIENGKVICGYTGGHRDNQIYEFVPKKTKNLNKLCNACLGIKKYLECNKKRQVVS